MRRSLLAGALVFLPLVGARAAVQSYDLISTGAYVASDGTKPAAGTCVGRAAWDGVTAYSPPGVTLALDAGQTVACYQPLVPLFVPPPAPIVTLPAAPDGQGNLTYGRADGTTGMVATAIPRPISTVPASATNAGSAGSANNFAPSDATPASGTRSARVTTAADGTFSQTWSVPLTSATPVAVVVPLNSGSNPLICNVSTITPAMVSGRCWQITSVTPSVSWGQPCRRSLRRRPGLP